MANDPNDQQPKPASQANKAAAAESTRKRGDFEDVEFEEGGFPPLDHSDEHPGRVSD